MNILRIGTHTLPLPSYAHPGDAGLDLAARIAGAPLRSWNAWGEELDIRGYLERGDAVLLAPSWRIIIPCGFAVELPPGHCGTVRPRSSCFKRGLGVALGTVDEGYRGEILIGVYNLGSAPVRIEHGERIAQLVVSPVARVEVLEVDALSETARGAGALGSTGR